MELFDPHGGYRRLDSFTLTTIVYLATIRFCNTFLNLRNDPKGRLYDQMVQAARSGRANIMEGSERTSTSKETEIKLVDVARASLVELLILCRRVITMLDHQMKRLGENFRESGGFRERT